MLKSRSLNVEFFNPYTKKPAQKSLDFRLRVQLYGHVAIRDVPIFNRERESSIRHSMRGRAEGVTMLTKRTLLVVVFCSLVFSICPLLHGQATGSFLGAISDKTGSVIAGAKVTVTSQGTGVSRESKSDDTGHYL